MVSKTGKCEIVVGSLNMNVFVFGCNLEGLTTGHV